MMETLIIGGGGREHCLVWKIKKSVSKIFCIPGNGGISHDAETVDIKLKSLDELLKFAKEKKIDLTIVGPEAPLVSGIVDKFREGGLKIFGPNKLASQIEGSKIFAKELMKKYNLPTGSFEIFDNSSSAIKYIEKRSLPIVVKADGLAQGKGVIVANSKDEAIRGVEDILDKRIFGDSGKRIIIEEYLSGEEFSFIVFTDGETIVPLQTAQDYKRVYDGDKGPNTGGMGSYSPVPFISKSLQEFAQNKIMKATVKSLYKEGITYQGVLYGGLILTKEGVKVLEFNSRFGDPETQAVLPLLKTDLVEIIENVLDFNLHKVKIEWHNKVCVCVVLSSGGYPGEYEKGKEIRGLEDLKDIEDLIIFHAGTKKEDNKFLTSGGRVLGVCAMDINFKLAIDKVYKNIEKIKFEKMHYRSDIGRKVL